MSAEIVNLNQFRKSRDKERKAEQAAENRRKFGRSKAERLAEDKAGKAAESDLDGKRLDPDNPTDGNEKPA